MRLPYSNLRTLIGEILRPLAAMPRGQLVAALAARCGWSAFAVELAVVRLVERRRLSVTGDGASALLSLAAVPAGRR